MKKIIYLLLALACASLSAHATETSWNYVAYDVVTGDKTADGYITLTENAGAAKLLLMAGRMNKCFSQKLDAVVERTTDATTIVAEPIYRGCDKLRFVLKADGTGGTREVWAVDKWEMDPRNRVLTLRP
jgi:hypothetical protein